jgi:hypothetical protein
MHDPISSHPYDKRVIEQAHELIYKLLDRITELEDRLCAESHYPVPDCPCSSSNVLAHDKPYRGHQVFDLPKVSYFVTWHQLFRAQCINTAEAMLPDVLCLKRYRRRSHRGSCFVSECKSCRWWRRPNDWGAALRSGYALSSELVSRKRIAPSLPSCVR